MSDHRVELRVTFTVGDGDGGRYAAHEVLRQLELFGTHLGDLASDFEVAPGTVDGVGWYEKWPARDAFTFPGVPVELRPLLVAVANVVTEELRQPGERADLIEATIQNRIRHAFEGREL